MTAADMAKQLNLEVLVDAGAEREVTGGYCGDLLSWVMGRASEGDAWITVMGNLNAVAVAVLADAACIILSESSVLDADAKARAEQQEVPVYRSGENTFSLCCKLGKLLGV